LCARHVYQADGLKETLSPNQREDNQQARAPLATVGSEGSRGGVLEHSASEPRLACRGGNPAKDGEAPSVPCEGAGKRGTNGNTRPSEALGVADKPVVG